MTKFIVMRKATLMEDEGRDEFLKICKTKEEAALFIQEYCDRSKGYFRPGELYVAEALESQA